MDLPKQVGERARAIRALRSMTQEQLAERAGIDVRHLQKIEAGQVNLTLKTLERLAQALQVLPSELV